MRCSVRCRPGAVALAALVALVLARCAAPAARAEDGVALSVGDSTVLEGRDVRRVSLGNPRVAEVTIVSPSELEVVGLAEGATTLLVWDGEGRKRLNVVVSPDAAGLAERLAGEIGEPGVSVRVTGRSRPTVVLTGTLPTVAQVSRAERIAVALAGPRLVINLLTVSEEVADRGADLRELLAEPGVEVEVVARPSARRLLVTSAPGATAPTGSAVSASSSTGAASGAYPPGTGEGDFVLLRGTVETQHDRERALALARAVSSRVVDQLEVSSPVQVAVQATLLEISRLQDDSLGVTWGAGAPFTATGSTLTVPSAPVQNTFSFFENLYRSSRGDVSAIGPRVKNGFTWPWEVENLNRVDPLMAQLKFQAQRGSTQTLAEPRVVVASGQMGSIRVGGQIPVPAESAKGGSSIQYKTYGLTLEVTPRLDRRGSITLPVVLTWITPVDYSQAQTLNGVLVPALRERSAALEVTMRDGESVVIAGVMTRDEARALGGIPLLRKLPVLGALFRSESFRRGVTELVVVLTTRVLRTDRSRARATMSPEPGRALQVRGPVDALADEVARALAGAPTAPPPGADEGLDALMDRMAAALGRARRSGSG